MSGTAAGDGFGHLADDLAAVLAAYQPADPGQLSLRTAYVEHLRAHPDAVARSGPPTHFTASCLVLDPGADRVLLTHHRRARQWFQFGGHLEATDLGVHAAAEREAREESGIASLVAFPHPVQLDRHILAGDFGRCREHLDIRFVALADGADRPVVGAESLDVRWWPLGALPEPTDRSLGALVGAARAAVERGESWAR